MFYMKCFLKIFILLLFITLNIGNITVEANEEIEIHNSGENYNLTEEDYLFIKLNEVMPDPDGSDTDYE